MKIDNRAKVREIKRIERTLIKFRDRVNSPLLREEDKRDEYFSLRGKTPLKNDDGRVRVYHEFNNRTKRKREALKYEIKASGENLLEAA